MYQLRPDAEGGSVLIAGELYTGLHLTDDDGREVQLLERWPGRSAAGAGQPLRNFESPFQASSRISPSPAPISMATRGNTAALAGLLAPSDQTVPRVDAS